MEQQPRLPLWFLVVNWALIAVAFFMGTLLSGRRASSLPEPQLTALETVYREVLQSHVDKQDEHELLERAIAGMVNGLDPYSRYVPPSNARSYDESSTGHYQGIGAEMGVHGDDVVVHFPFANGPAERAGLLPGDRLAAIDGQVIDTAERRESAVESVRGQAGTEVRLRIRRDEQELDVVVKRDDVQRPCVRWAHLLDAEAGIGYVYLSDFHADARDQLAAAIAGLEASGPLRGLVLDLRFDGGGLLDECIEIARLFLNSGTIVTQQRRDSEIIERHEAIAAQCRYPDLSLVVLVNAESASASEVLTGALQDHGRAAVVGEPTHGKACVNTQYSWKGFDFRLKLTTGRYRTPNGRDIESNYPADKSAKGKTGGITPDVLVSITMAQKAQLQVALQAMEAPPQHRAALLTVAARYGFQVANAPDRATDPELNRAVEVLRERMAAGNPNEAGTRR